MKCIVCNSTFPIKPIERYSIEFQGELIEVCPHLCMNCGFVFLDPLPNEELMHRYYAAQNRVPTETYAYQSQAEWIGPTNGKVLDIGAYDGRLLRELKKNGATGFYGVEPDESVEVIFPHQRFASLDDIPDGLQFDIITMMHVLEHLREPIETLMKCRKLLAPNGRIYIEVPNLESPYVQTVPFWTPQHLWYFKPSTLRAILTGADLYVVTDNNALPYSGLRSYGLARSEVPYIGGRFWKDDCPKMPVEIYQAKRKIFLERSYEKLFALRNRSVAIFGTGEHTAFLLKQFGDILNPEYYIDSYRGGSYQSRPIYKPDDINDIDVVLISSYDNQEEMAALVGEKAVTLYDNPVAYDTWRGEI